jgi:hypothetical protein
MAELNSDAPGAGTPGAASADTAWPELAVSGDGPLDRGVSDPAVRAILDRVREVPGLPVSEHADAYAGMHDALLEALNEEPGRDQPRLGPGAP